MKAKAVIGSLYGDEGKGSMVDYFAHEAMEQEGRCMVVRSNGGAQAAHTVQLPDGTRHVFHHFGSGTLVGAETFLSRFFVVNPILFNKEWDELAALGVTPKVTIDPHAKITFHTDMLLNQSFETLRGALGVRHGSCGVGFGEACWRGENNYISPSVEEAHFMVEERKRGRLNRVAVTLNGLREAVQARLTEMRIKWDDLPDEFRPFFYDAEVIENYIDNLELMFDRVEIAETFARDIPVIFEGAQGLGLDRDLGWFPFVTRSKTGMFNVAELCHDFGIDKIEAVYVMRAYATRHGAGPLDWVNRKMDGYTLEDPTNKPNEWQGALRFAPLDLTYIKRLIDLDKAGLRNLALDIERTVAVTCLDQTPSVVEIRAGSKDPYWVNMRRSDIIEQAMHDIGVWTVYAKSSPTRESVETFYRR